MGIDQSTLDARCAAHNAQTQARRAALCDDNYDPSWPTPSPIPSLLLPVESFTPLLLPVSLRGWVADIADRMQCPPDYAAVAAMVALSSVVGRKVVMQPKRKDDWLVVPNLWGAIIGRPATMKSPTFSQVLKPLDKLQALASQKHTLAMDRHQVDIKLGAMEGKDAEKKAQTAISKGKRDEAEALLFSAAADESAAPPLRRYQVNNATVEALGEILMDNPWGTLAYRDELYALLKSLDKDGNEDARGFYLQGYDGNQPYVFDRIARGKNNRIPAVCISLLGGIQPGRLKSYIRDAVSGGSGDDGLVQRFGLLVWPDVSKTWRNVDRFPDLAAKEAADSVFARLDAIQPDRDADGNPVAVVMQFDEFAQVEFDEWRAEFETELKSGDLHPALESHLGKYRKLVPALAVLCSLCDGDQAVTVESLRRSLSWSEYLRSHAERVYAAGTSLDTDAATELLKRIRAGDVVDGFSIRDIYRKGWAYLNTPLVAKSAAEMLEDLNYLRAIEHPAGVAGGRPTLTYMINPATLPEVAHG